MNSEAVKWRFNSFSWDSKFTIYHPAVKGNWSEFLPSIFYFAIFILLLSLECCECGWVMMNNNNNGNNNSTCHTLMLSFFLLKSLIIFQAFITIFRFYFYYFFSIITGSTISSTGNRTIIEIFWNWHRIIAISHNMFIKCSWNDTNLRYSNNKWHTWSIQDSVIKCHMGGGKGSKIVQKSATYYLNDTISNV